jgi:hypothetical protein
VYVNGRCSWGWAWACECEWGWDAGAYGYEYEDESGWWDGWDGCEYLAIGDVCDSYEGCDAYVAYVVWGGGGDGFGFDEVDAAHAFDIREGSAGLVLVVVDGFVGEVGVEVGLRSRTLVEAELCFEFSLAGAEAGSESNLAEEAGFFEPDLASEVCPRKCLRIFELTLNARPHKGKGQRKAVIT